MLGSYTLVALVRQGYQLGAYKLVRQAFELLEDLIVPSKWQQELDFLALAVRAKPFSDRKELIEHMGTTVHASPWHECSACVLSRYMRTVH